LSVKVSFLFTESVVFLDQETGDLGFADVAIDCYLFYWRTGILLVIVLSVLSYFHVIVKCCVVPRGRGNL